ncbi:hypothetical protein ABZ848_20040 [Streptomyces sp. NPDC047081]
MANTLRGPFENLARISHWRISGRPRHGRIFERFSLTIVTGKQYGD